VARNTNCGRQRVDGSGVCCVGMGEPVDEISVLVTQEMSLKCFRPFPHKWVEEQIHNQIATPIARGREAAMQTTKHKSDRGGKRYSSSGDLTPLPGGAGGAEKWGRSSREQLDRAARVQRSLLPDVSVPVAGFKVAGAYRPCEALGGDFYDICRQPECATLMVADAMGHGAEAALVTMLLKAVFQELAPQVGTTDALLTRMNERLLGLIPAGSFAATTVARLDQGSSEIQISNAGLPFPFVLRASTQSVHKLRLTGVPLGMNVNGGYQEYGVCRVKLAPGDVLLISSDGIGSVERKDGMCFERLLGLTLASLVGLAGDEVIQSLLTEAVEFSSGRPFPDDINLVAVSRDQLGERH
jgi:serine phosphatase RsbU (regulator of sigma subunit)